MCAKIHRWSTILSTTLLLLPSFCAAFTFNMKKEMVSQANWQSLVANRVSVDPDDLVKANPQLAKDADYATAIQKAWKQDVDKRLTTTPECESTATTYQDEDGCQLYGHLFRRRNGSSDQKVPGILFFHTGAGPHDVCLQWKADSLVTNEDIFPNGCVILVADILSDDTGWCWSPDRTRYNESRSRVLAVDEETNQRTELRKRLSAALRTLESVPEVDPACLAALGWCLGGHSILELARMKHPGLRSMATYHGVFDGVTPPEASSANDSVACEVLVCNGAEDPFVPKEALERSSQTMERCGCKVHLLNHEGARHGFTNPAQDFNPNPAFAFHTEAAAAAWGATEDLLRRTLG